MTSRLRLLSLLAFTLATISGAAGADLTIDEVIAHNTEAMGGGTVVEALQSVAITAHVSDPDFEVDGIYYATRPGRMRVDITAGGKHVFTEAFDGEKGWQWNGKEQMETGPVPTAALRHGVELPGNLFGLHELSPRGHRVELSGRERLDDVEYYVLHVTLKDGYECLLFVDPATWRITRRRDVRALHPDIDPTPTTIESRNSDWRQVDGHWFSFAGENVDLKTGKVIESSRVQQIEVNPPIDSAIFSRL